MALNDVPLSSQSLADTQNPIRQNFSTINTVFEVDHVAYGAAGQGQHAKVTLPVQAPAPTFAAGLLGIYSFLNANTAKNEAYIHKQTGATTANIPFTASVLSSSSAPAAGSGGWTYLPSGLILIFGNETGLTGGSKFIDYTGVGIPSLVQALTVIVTPFNTNGGDQNFAVRLIDISLTNTQFEIYVSSRTSTGAASGSIGGVQYLVIGY